MPSIVRFADQRHLVAEAMSIYGKTRLNAMTCCVTAIPKAVAMYPGIKPSKKIGEPWKGLLLSDIPRRIMHGIVRST